MTIADGCIWERPDYALRFNREEDSNSFWIGCSNYETNRAFVLCIEAARLLVSNNDIDDDLLAVKLLKLAIKEIEQHKRNG